MPRSINKQIFYRAVLSAPVIAFLIITPLFIVYEGKLQTYFELWSKTLFSTFFWWTTQILIFRFFKKKNYPKWAIIIAILFTVFMILLLTNYLTPILTPGLTSFSPEIVFLFRMVINISANFIIFLLLDLIYSREEKLRLVEDNSKLRYDNLDSKFKLLKAQINPHFLFNALSVSKSLIKNKPNEAEKYIVGLSEFLRNSLNNQKKSMSLQKELKHAQQFVELQKVRFENAIEYEVKVDKNYSDRHLPFFTLITLIENAIKHNAFTIENPLKISGWVEDDFFCIRNEMNPKKGVISTNTGLSNLNERSQMFSGEEIRIENDGQTFTVKVKLVDV